MRLVVSFIHFSFGVLVQEEAKLDIVEAAKKGKSSILFHTYACKNGEWSHRFTYSISFVSVRNFDHVCYKLKDIISRKKNLFDTFDIELDGHRKNKTL